MEWLWQLNDSHSSSLFPDTTNSLSEVFYFLLSTCTKSVQLEVHLNEQFILQSEKENKSYVCDGEGLKGYGL